MTQPLINLDVFQTLLEEHADKFSRFSELLITENAKYNLTRIDSTPQIEARHFLDSMAGLYVLDDLAQKASRPLNILDIGSGAGFPGLVLAIVRPQWQITSLEATEKKMRFQKMVCSKLELENVTVLAGRAEGAAQLAAYRQQYDAVTARALAAMPILAELSLGFVKIGGVGLYWKGPSVAEELQTAAGAVKQMGAELESTLTYTLGMPEGESAKPSLVVCRKIKSTPDQYPRVFGIIKKKPLS